MAVKLREKKLVRGKVSLYLDITKNGKRWFEFLDIHVNRKKPTPEDTAKRKLAHEIKVKREQEIIVRDHSLVDKKGKHADFIQCMEHYLMQRAHNGHRLGTLMQLRRYTENKPLPIAHVTAEWLKAFELFMLATLKTTTVMTYLRNICAALNELVRKRNEREALGTTTAFGVSRNTTRPVPNAKALICRESSITWARNLSVRVFSSIVSAIQSRRPSNSMSEPSGWNLSF